MEAIIPVLIVLVVVGLVIYALEKMPAPIAGPAKVWIEVIVVLLAAAYLAQRYLIA
ncbi:MAG: hypothetical protein ACRCYS_04980 [Beijerinckiaceae bacterium]